jgi:ComF family protein
VHLRASASLRFNLFLLNFPSVTTPAWLNRVLDFCFPGQCICCGAGFDRDSAELFCGDCEHEMQSLASSPACELCALPLTAHNAPCPYCHGKGVALLERVVSLGVFRDPLKIAIHHAKYSQRWPLAEQLTDRLIEQEHAKALLQETDVLAPVPLHRTRQMERGYNQADVIARRLGKRCGIRVASSAAARVRDTPTQTNLHSRAKRVENLRGAFALLNPGALAGKHVTLVDDVMTTGATLQALARTISPASPASISAMVIAIADPRGRGFEVI